MEAIKNKAIEREIKRIAENRYTEEIISVSDVQLLCGSSRECDSLIQGDYPVDVRFTPMQSVQVTYLNKYFGICKATIIGSFDAVRYEAAESTAYEGAYMNEHLIKVDFIGEYATIKSWR